MHDGDAAWPELGAFQRRVRDKTTRVGIGDAYIRQYALCASHGIGDKTIARLHPISTTLGEKVDFVLIEELRRRNDVKLAGEKTFTPGEACLIGIGVAYVDTPACKFPLKPSKWLSRIKFTTPNRIGAISRRCAAGHHFHILDRAWGSILMSVAPDEFVAMSR